MSVRILIKSCVLFISLVCLGLAFKWLDLTYIFNKSWIDGVVREQGLSGALTFIMMGSAATAVGFPRQAVSFMSGYAFGFYDGTILALAATSIGCIISFSYARFLGRELVCRFFTKKIKRIDNFLSKSPFLMTVLIRFLPLGNNLITCLGAGVSSVRALAFITGSAFGYIPQTCIFALVGSGVQLDAFPRIALSAALFLIAAFIGVHLYQKFWVNNFVDEGSAK